LKRLRLDKREPVRIGGWAFRGLLNLPVTWEADSAQLLARSNVC